jgi:hypothetical protein
MTRQPKRNLTRALQGPNQVCGYVLTIPQKRSFTMDSVTLIRIVSGLLFVVVLVVLVQRRRTKLN